MEKVKVRFIAANVHKHSLDSIRSKVESKYSARADRLRAIEDPDGDDVFSKMDYITRGVASRKHAARVVARVAASRKGAVTLRQGIPDADLNLIFSALNDGFARVASEHEVDEIFARVHAEMPWLHKLTTVAWKNARAAAGRGEPVRVGNIIALGPPGCGKSTWARTVARELGTACAAVDAGASAGVFDLQGVSAGWSTAHAGAVVRVMLETCNAAPVIIIDEVDAGGAVAHTSRGGSVPGLITVLMGMLEKTTAARWVCPYFGIPFDLRLCSFLMTSNNISHVDQALIDRATVVEIDGDVSWAVALDCEVPSFMMHFGKMEGEITADSIAKLIAAGWDDAWTEVPAGDTILDWGLGSGDFAMKCIA